jgi:HupE / UreJ protein
MNRDLSDGFDTNHTIAALLLRPVRTTTLCRDRQLTSHRNVVMPLIKKAVFSAPCVFVRASLLLIATIFSDVSTAHLLPAQNATLNIIDNAAFIVVSVPVSALQGVDDDSDGLLSLVEMQRHNAAIIRQFQARFQMTDGGVKGQTVLSWVVPPQTDHDTTDSNYLVLMQRINFPNLIALPTVSTDLFGTREGEAQMTMTATRDFAKTASETSKNVAAITNQVREVAILRPGNGQHQFFRGPWAIFRDFVRIGGEHILSGTDHLLFLLTIIVGAAGWRYWLGVITCFTIAHSITLTLSALNVMRFPASVIEPCIAASIVLMALLNLASLRATSQGIAVSWLHATGARMGIVFACGLLHGCGFASAIGAMSVATPSRIATLAGFNIGIEIGQFLFVATALLLMAIFKKLGWSRIAEQLPSVASYAAIVLGLWFFLNRIGVI